MLTHAFLPTLATCFKMLQDMNSADPFHLKYIIKKIKNMAHGSPKLVMETIHDYFRDNPEVGTAWATGAGTGGRGGGWDPKVGSNPRSCLEQLHGLGQVSISSYVKWAKWGGRKVDPHALTTLRMRS